MQHVYRQLAQYHVCTWSLRLTQNKKPRQMSPYDKTISKETRESLTWRTRPVDDQGYMQNHMPCMQWYTTAARQHNYVQTTKPGDPVTVAAFTQAQFRPLQCSTQQHTRQVDGLPHMPARKHIKSMLQQPPACQRSRLTSCSSRPRSSPPRTDITSNIHYLISPA